MERSKRETYPENLFENYFHRFLIKIWLIIKLYLLFNTLNIFAQPVHIFAFTLKLLYLLRTMLL